MNPSISNIIISIFINFQESAINNYGYYEITAKYKICNDLGVLNTRSFEEPFIVNKIYLWSLSNNIRIKIRIEVYNDFSFIKAIGNFLFVIESFNSISICSMSSAMNHLQNET